MLPFDPSPWSLRLARWGVVATFALSGLWLRLPGVPPPLPPLYVSRFVIFLPLLWTIGWWLIAGLPGLGRLRHDPHRRLWALALLLLALWAFASQLWAFQRGPHPDVAANAALQFGTAALFALAAGCAAPPRRAVLAALTISLIVHAAIAGAQVANQGALGLDALGEFAVQADAPGVSVVQAGNTRLLRPYGLMPHPNMVAGALVIGVLAACALALSPGRWRLAGTAAAALGLYALLLTFSRAAWIGLAAGLALLALVVWRAGLLRRALPLALSLLAAGALFAALYWPFVLARAGAGDETTEQRSVADRVVYTQFALRAVTEYPLAGVGSGNFPWRASYYLMFVDFDLRGDNVHNVYLSAWAELGTVGLALLTLALAAGTWAAVRALRVDSDPARAALFAGFVALAVIGLFDHYPWTMLHFQAAWWGLLALAAAPEGG
jgi:hypothetical protein